MAHILVTGGAGYIGSHTALALIDAGWQPVIIDNLVTGKRELIPDGADFIEGDISDSKLVRSTLQKYNCRAVLHFAGSTVVPESVSDPLKYYENNTCASRSLIESVVAANVEAMIFSSTAAVYGDPDTLPISEDLPAAPINPYGVSKLMTEWMLRDVAAATSLRYVALRYFNVAGADPQGRSGQMTPEATHLIKVACQAACGTRDSITIFGDDYDTEDGTGVRDYIHVSDLADAHVAALAYLLDGGESTIMNCGYGRGYSVKQVVDMVGAVAGVEMPVIMGPRRPGDSGAVYASSDRIRKTLGWAPQYDDLETIVTSAYKWEQKINAA
ncbi:MAG: UDP-glucose 4-epimerase GalE [Alphaproteobacteria bacterium]|nr:UDP-glucose 4-epimerase GalE [Alphaproteobacteria bacterium]